MIGQFIFKQLIYWGHRLANLGYLLAYPSYAKVRGGRGSAEIYQLLNKKWFTKIEIKLVIDIGANEGQFIRTSLALMPNTSILAFEPNPISVQNLLQKANWNTEQVKIFSLGLGNSKDNLLLNVSKFSPASSLLKNSERLNQEFPDLLTEKIVDVKIDRLDNILKELDIPLCDRSLLIKIDVQGFELEVLKGANTIFEKIAVIICEVNLSLLYENQSNFDEIIGFLYLNNFRLIDIGQPIRSRFNEEILYVDVAFICNKII